LGGLVGGASGGAGEGGGGDPNLTPRQGQILELAAAGLADKEIAARLGIAHRTVRSHLEKLYHERGIRNRSQAIALWSGRSRVPHGPRPDDECPYPKPFPPGFTECPAYQATQMVALDISERPMGSVLTCRHLASRLIPSTNFRWYGACLIGDANARRRWSTAVGATRLHDINLVRQEISALSGPFVQRLWELKSTTGRPDSLAAQRQMRGVVDQFMTSMTTLLKQRQDVLDRLNLPLDSCLRLVRYAIDRFVNEGLSEADWDVPDEILGLFPDEVRAYFRPDLGDRRAWQRGYGRIR